jgi:hypothetical protein
MWMAMLSVLLTWFILAVVGKFEHRISASPEARADDIDHVA